MSLFSIHVDVVPLLAFLVHGCSGVVKKTVDGSQERFTTKGKCARARRILIKAGIDLSRIQPTLDDSQKERFAEALTIIEDWFTVLRTEKKAAGRRSAAKVLLQEAEAFEDDVVATSTLQILNIAVNGKDAPAYRLFEKYTNSNVDPIEVIQQMKAQLYDQPTSNKQKVKPQKTAKAHSPALDPEQLATALMDGLENLTEVDMDIPAE